MDFPTFILLPGEMEAGVEIVEIVKELISNMGFPIACVVAMFVQMEQERKAHKEESDKWVEALNRNTTVMEKILDRLEVKT